LVPNSGALALSNVSRLPFVDDGLRWRIHSEREMAAQGFNTPTVVGTVTPNAPEASLANMQYAFRLGGWIGGQDIGISYYRGFSDIPVANSTHSVQDLTQRCNPNDAEDCIDGMLYNEVGLVFPKMQVAGLNLAGEVNALGFLHHSIQPIGYRLEAALILPEEIRLGLTNDDIQFGVISQPAGEYDYELDDGGRPIVVQSRPFAKWVLGLDYTFGRHVYVNTQWVHGTFDEFGAGDFLQPGFVVRDGGVNSDTLGTAGCSLARNGEKCAWESLRSRIGDYLVVGFDIRFLSNAALLRLFSIVDLTGAVETRWDEAAGQRVQTTFGPFSKEGFGLVVFPQLAYNLGGGLELSTGALLQLGPKTGKFGSPEAGGSMVWSQAKYSF